MTTNEGQYEDGSPDQKKFGFGIRHIQIVLCFMSIAINAMDKAHVGVTIVAMTTNNINNRSNLNTAINITRSYSVNNTQASVAENGIGFNEDTKFNIILNTKNDSNDINDEKIHTFNWPKSTQQMIVGFYYVGNCVTMLPVVYVCHRWGGKIPLQITFLINGIVDIVTPWMSYWCDWKAVCFCRFMQGLVHVTIFPCVLVLIAKWAPSCELAQLVALVYAGLPLGNVLGPQLAGILGASKWGWPSTYWLIGIINLIGLFLLTMFGSETPLKHSSIKEEEKSYILRTTNIENFQKLKIPWKAIFKSKPVWATFVEQVGSCVCYIFFLTEVPSFIYYIYGCDIKSSGMLTSWPYIGSIFVGVLFGFLSDFLTNKNITSVKNARRIFNSISQCGAAFALITVSFINNVALVVLCFVFSFAAGSASRVGWLVSYIDLAPNFSGVLTTIGNVFMDVVLLLLPLFISFAITDQTDVMQWRIVLFVLAALCITANTVYVCLISAETQPWNYVNNNNNLSEHKDDDMKEKTRL